MSIWTDAPKNTRQVFEYLKTRAARMRTESYGEIAAAIGLEEWREAPAVTLHAPLIFIRDRICRPRGLPWLNALAVNAETGLPGDSFLAEAVAPGDNERVLWRGAVLAVFGYPWETVYTE